MGKAAFRRGLGHGVPIALGYLSVAFAFGIQAAGGGLTPLQAVLISMTNLTSAGQVAGLSLMVAGAPLYEMALTQLTINLRYALMSLSLSQKLDSSMTLPHRLLLSFCNTDEVFVVASQQPGKVGRAYLYGLTNGPSLGWVLGTLLGALAGGLLPAAVTEALGIAIYGMFIAIVLPPFRRSREVRAVVLVALPAAPALMVRGVLYTGLTRARELLVVVGDDSALSRMAANDRQQRRYSGLRWRLKKGAGA